MRRINKLIFTIMMFLFPLYVFAEGSITLDKSNLELNVGDSLTFTVTATDASGNIDITSSNDKINLTSNSSNFTKDAEIDNKWHLSVNNNSTSITVSGVSEGNANIILTATDVISSTNVNITYNDTISVTVNHAPSSNADLADIKIDDVPLNGFKSDVYTYNLTLEKTSIDIAATVDEEHARVTGVGENQELNYGLNVIKLIVTAEDNVASKTYTLNITRPDNRETNTFLKRLTVSEGILVFNKNTINYQVVIDEDVTSVNIEAEAEGSKATITGTGVKTIAENNNIFEIIVTAENETTKKYTITFVKEDEVIITYNSNGGDMCSPNSKLVERNTKMGALCKPARTGYVFNGWYTESSGGSRVTSETVATKDFTIYAQWTKKVTESPATGINKPITFLVTIALLGVVGYIVFKKKNINFD